MICVTHGSIGAAVSTPHPRTTRRFGFLDSWRQSCGVSLSCSQRTGLESLRSNSWNASPVNGSCKRAGRHGYTTYVRCPRPVDEGSALQPIIVNSRNMPSVSEVTLALAALANPAQHEVAYCAVVRQAGNGSHKRSAAQTIPRLPNRYIKSIIDILKI